MEDQNDINGQSILEHDPEVDIQEIISLNKFIFLSIITFGIYEIWWIYKAWKFYKQRDKLDILPVARTILSLLFLYPLLNTILESAKEKGYNYSYSSGVLFICFIVLNLLGNLPEPFWFISIFSFICLIPPFKALNYLKQSSTEFMVIEQASFNGRQISLIVIGIIFWGLVIFGTMLL